MLIQDMGSFFLVHPADVLDRQFFTSSIIHSPFFFFQRSHAVGDRSDLQNDLACNLALLQQLVGAGGLHQGEAGRNGDFDPPAARDARTSGAASPNHAGRIRRVEPMLNPRTDRQLA